MDVIEYIQKYREVTVDKFTCHDSDNDDYFQ
jgi:hypothetical protein